MKLLSAIALAALLAGAAQTANAQAAVTLSSPLSIIITGKFPNSLAFTPSAPKIAWNVPVGTVVAAIAVTNADGSAFTGTLSFSDPTGDFSISGNNIVTAKALTAASVGTVTVTVTASE